MATVSEVANGTQCEVAMKKRIAGLAVVVAIGVIYLYASTFCSGVSLGNCLCIRAGDHVEDVEKRLGDGKNGPDVRTAAPLHYPNPGWLDEWEGPFVTITIIYDRDSRVITTSMRMNLNRGSWIRENMTWLIKFQEVRE